LIEKLGNYKNSKVSEGSFKRLLAPRFKTGASAEKFPGGSKDKTN